MDSQKLKVLGFIGFLLVTIVLLLLFLLFDKILLLIFFCFSFVAMIFFAALLYKTDSSDSSLKELLRYYKLKEKLLLQKTNIQKQYLKRQISEKQFKQQINSIDKKIFLIDYRLQFPDVELDKEKDLKRKQEFLQKQYFKQNISEELYNELQLDISKELAQLAPKRKELKKK